MPDPLIPRDLLYNRDHYWIGIDGEVATFGLTEHAQNELGDIVYLKTPDVGNEYHATDEIGEIASVKTHTELYAPISGEILEVNEALDETPSLVNEDPYGEGWIARIRISDPSEVEDLIAREDYGHLGEEGE